MNHPCSTIVLLLISFGVAAYAQPERLTDGVRGNLHSYERFVANVVPALNKHAYGDPSFECGMCAIAVNEVEGFLVENLTLYEMESKLKEDVCDKLGLKQILCDAMVDMLPTLLEAIEQQNGVGTVCVEVGMCSKPPSNHADPVNVPTFTINLDLPPTQRWTEVCSVPSYGLYTREFVNLMMEILPGDLDGTGKLINDHYLPTEFAMEIQGCAQQLGVSYGWLTILNLGYEVTDACTSIVAQTLDGQIYHARNLDFGTGIWLSDTMRNMTFQAEFTKNGKLLFYATTFAGFVGVLSGQRPHAFSVTINTRFYPQGIVQLFYEVIAAIQERNASLVTFLSRNALTQQSDFASAVEQLSHNELIADVYYTVAGVSAGQGAVITRNRLNATDVWMLDAPERWFEVQTNYDHWEQPPWFDNRLTPANDGMMAMGRKALSLQGMFQVLSIKPVFNIMTTYSILSCPATATYKSYARWCNYPCVE